MTRKEHQTRRQILDRLEKTLYGVAAHAADQVDRGNANLGGWKKIHYHRARALLFKAHRLCVQILKHLK